MKRVIVQRKHLKLNFIHLQKSVFPAEQYDTNSKQQTMMSEGKFRRDVLSSLCVCPWPHSSKADLEGQPNMN